MIEFGKVITFRSCLLLWCVLIFGCATESTKPTRDQQVAQMCRANLREMQAIKQRWAAAERKGPNDVITWHDLVQMDRYLISRFECPAGGAYDWGRVSEPATCSVSGHSLK